MIILSLGNVYSFDAIQELNLKPKNFRDLLTDEAFTKEDMITLQDPKCLDKFNISEFYHIKHDLSWQTDEDPSDPMKHIRHITCEAKAALEEVYSEEKKARIEKAKTNTSSDCPEELTDRNKAHYSTGTASVAFTSTAMPRETHITPAILGRDTIRYGMVKKKGYVRIVTNFGDINLELHCEYVPKTCENFIKLCKKSYYDETIFHRSIRNFILQGGDPKGDGTGGDSLWGGEFKDEFKSHLVHSGRGILSMANSGPDTNRSQFFITYRLCMHLNNKHSVFGKVVGGFEVIDEIEKIETDKKDVPISEVKILTTIVFVDPFQEVDDQLSRESEKKLEEKTRAEKVEIDHRLLPPKSNEIIPKTDRVVGRYIDVKKDVEKLEETGSKRKIGSKETADVKKKVKPSKSGFSDFSSW